MNHRKAIIITAVCLFSANIHAELSCPTTVRVGQPLVISSADFINDDCHDDFVIKNSVLSLIGNSGTGIGLQGPFVAPLASTIPHATCESVPFDPENPEYGSYTRVISKGQQTLNNLVVIKKVPVSMKGTLVLASVGVLNAENKLKMAGQCLVTVAK